MVQSPSEIETGSLSRTRSTTRSSRKKLDPKSKRTYWPIMWRKRSSGGLSKPYSFSSRSISSGSRPRAPRYLLVSARCEMSNWLSVPTSPGPAPEMRAVAPTALPVSSAIACSTGPPGAIWMIAKLITMIANSVGMISSRRRTM